MNTGTIPRQCNTAAAIANVAAYLVHTDGLDHKGALYLAERILGIQDGADPHCVRNNARHKLQETAS